MKSVAVFAPVLSLILLAGVCRAAPVHFKELIPILSVTLPGWTAEEPEGQTMTSPFEASTATAAFTSGDKRLEVAIYDGGPQVSAALSYLGQVEMESTKQSVKSVTVQGFKGMIVTQLKDNEAEMLIAVGDRFAVSLSLTGSKDAALVRSVADQLDLKKLAGLAR